MPTSPSGSRRPDKHARARGKEELSPGTPSSFEQHVHGRQRGVTAQIHLDRRREPAQRPLIADAAHEGGLGDAELEGDLLEFVVGQGVLEQDDDRGIAPLALADERVNPPQSMPEGDVDGFHH